MLPFKKWSTSLLFGLFVFANVLANTSKGKQIGVNPIFPSEIVWHKQSKYQQASIIGKYLDTFDFWKLMYYLRAKLEP